MPQKSKSQKKRQHDDLGEPDHGHQGVLDDPFFLDTTGEQEGIMGEAAPKKRKKKVKVKDSHGIAAASAKEGPPDRDPEEPSKNGGVDLDVLDRYTFKQAEEQEQRRYKARHDLRYFKMPRKESASSAGAGSIDGQTPSRTDDGYLTKQGAKEACVVCTGYGHKGWECPELRCFICFETGHGVKNCPNAKQKCSLCSRKGHSDEDGCILKALMDAARQSNWGDVHCMNCGEQGHLMCQCEESTSTAPTRTRQEQVTTARRVGAALLGRRAATVGTHVRWSQQQWWTQQSASPRSDAGFRWGDTRYDSDDGRRARSDGETSPRHGRNWRSGEGVQTSRGRGRGAQEAWPSQGRGRGGRGYPGSQRSAGWWDQYACEPEGTQTAGQNGPLFAPGPEEGDARAQLRSMLAQQKGRSGHQRGR